MKQSSLARMIPLCIAMTSPVAVMAEANLTDLTAGDPFYYTCLLYTSDAADE